MSNTETTKKPSESKQMLVKFTNATAQGLEDVKHALSKKRGKRVTKRELIEEATKDLISKYATEVASAASTTQATA